MTARVTTTPARAYYGVRACPRCDRVYDAPFTTDRDDPCPSCKKAEAHESAGKRRSPGAMPNRGPSKFWRVTQTIEDFRAGVTFDSYDFTTSLFLEAWPVGMQIERAGVVYTVIPGGCIQAGKTIYHIENNGYFVEGPWKKKRERQ